MVDSQLPIGVQSFRKIREGGYHYVDKTAFAAQLVRNSLGYFLSRPRRFGKSLFVETLKELFKGSEELFRGLAIHGQWDWSVRYPVIHLDFGGNYNKEDELENSISDMLGRIERAAGLSAYSTTLNGRFRDLIVGLRECSGQPVVVLIDEYDRPILDAIRNSELALRNRDTLHGFYSALKNEDGNIRFCFVTGVSRFAHVSLFSGNNHLHDITLSPEYSSICGYTESDLDNVFAKEIATLNRDEIRDWYNGYWWLGEDKVYNPFEILLLLDEQQFDARWYQSGTPSFLLDVMTRRGILPTMLMDIEVSSSEMLISDLDKLSIGSLLFQSGYMTIVEKNSVGKIMYYKLDYPNREVFHSFHFNMLSMLLSDEVSVALSTRASRLAVALEAGDTDEIESILRTIFSGIPYQWHAKPGAENFESYFASVVYSYFIGSGIDARVEDSTSDGRIDLTIVALSHIYLFEFKVVKDKPSGGAMRQLKDKNYAKKYRQHGMPIHLVAVEFSKKTRNIADFDSELA